MLETKIQELTAAVTQLTTAIEALRAQSVTTSVTSASAATTTTVDAPKPKKPKAPKAEEPAPAPEPTPEPTPEPAPVAEVTLKDIRDAAQAALDAGKLNDVVALNKRFGLKRISDAPVDQYSAILAALKEINADGQA
jgi:hypothetical protein